MKKSQVILVVIVLALIILNKCVKDEFSLTAYVQPHDFLSAQKYDKMEVQLVYVNGYSPGNDAISGVQSFLEARLNKPGGITFTQRIISSPGFSSYNLDDVRKMEQQYRSSFTGGSKITAFVFFADAPFSGNSGNARVLGMMYAASSMVIFEKSVQQNSGGVAQPPHKILEETVWEHEFGHIMGLVDFGTTMVSYHKDLSNGNHCNNSGCLMYYQAETSDIVGNLLGGNVPDLDPNCLADLKANGGK